MVEQRKTRRFQMRLPLKLIRRDSMLCSAEGETRNISSRGVFFVTNSAMRVGERIEYVIAMPAAGGQDSVQLRCLGQVLRTGDGEQTPEGLFGVAASLERYEFVRPPF